MDPCCFFIHPTWLTLLQKLAPHDRDYLLPSPATALAGCSRTEIRYDTAYALQGRLMYLLRDADGHFLTRSAPHFWTPHSGRNFLPSAASALDFDKSGRDYLGGWAAKGSDLYARVARLKITNIQRAVVRTVNENAAGDHLGEAETTAQLEVYMTLRNAPPQSVITTLEKLASWTNSVTDAVT